LKRPKAILFDYGQTIADEQAFDGVKGTAAVLEYAVVNRFNMTAEAIQDLANELNHDIGRYDPKTRNLYQLEVHNHPFQRYLYEYCGIELSLPPFEVEQIFWDHASPAVPTAHIATFLDYLDGQGIRTGVISNIPYSGAALAARIKRILPGHHFSFILASSDYVFRKPHRRIFELALRKLDMPADNVWYCGDNGFYDIEGAAQAGIYPVWYTGASESGQPQPACIHQPAVNWLDLIPLINRLIPD